MAAGKPPFIYDNEEKSHGRKKRYSLYRNRSHPYTPGESKKEMCIRDSVKDGTYTRIGGVFGSELLCRKRFEEKVMNGEIFYGIDLKTAVVAKRETVTLMEEWETMGNVNLEM